MVLLCAKVNRLTNLTSVSFPVLVPFTNELLDIGDWWDSSEPTKFIVPPDVKAVEIYGGAESAQSANTGSLFVHILKNGVSTDIDINGIFNHRNSATGFSNNVGCTHLPFDRCVEGDEYQLRVNKTGLGTTNSILATAQTFFSIRAIA